MALIEINGVEIDSFKDTARCEIMDVGDVDDRGVTGREFDNTVGEKRRWRFDTPPMHWTEAELIRKWITGRGHSWSFDGAKYSQTGVSNAIAGSFTQSSSSGKYGGKLNVGSASQFGVELSNKMSVPGIAGWAPTNGWTLMAWSLRTIAADGTPSDDWFDYLAHGAVTVTRGVSANPAGVTQYRNGAAGSFNMGNFTSMLVGTGNRAAITGHCQTALSTAGAKDYDDLVLLPFQVDPTWVADIAAFRAAQAWSPLPFVYLGGDIINNATPVQVKGRVKDIGYSMARGENNTSVLAVTLEER